MKPANWHSDTQAAMKTRCEDSLKFIIEDCNSAAKAAQDLGNDEAAGYYLDEMHYAAMELKSRRVA